jgi:hypothetical protein
MLCLSHILQVITKLAVVLHAASFSKLPQTLVILVNVCRDGASAIL